MEGGSPPRLLGARTTVRMACRRPPRRRSPRHPLQGGPEENTAVVATDAERYFLPPYVAHRGWVGAWLDIEGIDWERVEALLVEAYRLAAPRRLAARLDARE
jgi:hypothetical protein